MVYKNTDTNLPVNDDIPVYTMQENPDGDLHIYVRKYTQETIISDLKLNNKSSCLHRHEYIQINYIMEGHLRHVINHSEFEVSKGDIFIIPPYAAHELLPINEDPSIVYELEFEPVFIMENCKKSDDFKSFYNFAYIEPFLVSEGEIKPRFQLNGRNQILIESLLDDIYTEYTTREPGYILAMKADLLKLLLNLVRSFSQDDAHHEINSLCDRHYEDIRKAIHYIDDHFTENIRMDDVAKIAALSRSGFCSLFKTITGKTYIKYLNILRTNRAMELLQNSSKTMSEVALSSGFTNIHHFNRVFKAMNGVSPRIYRNANNQN